MSVVADVREVLQDLVAPDLKAIREKVESLEKRIDRLENRVESGFAKVDGNVRAGGGEDFANLSSEW